MNKTLSTILFSIFILVFQILVFNRLHIPVTEQYTIWFFIYPLIILGIPFEVAPVVLMLIAFGLGLGLDVTMDSLGVNAGALVFTAFMRPFIIKMLEPVDGYTVLAEPSILSMGSNWYLRYSGILLFLHILVFFCLEYFSIVYTGTIIIQTILSFVASWLMILLVSVLFRR